MLGKVPTLLLRLSCILQALHDSFEHIMSLEPSQRFILDSKIEEHLSDYFKSQTQTIISSENIERAHQLLQYFNKNKLVLAGYDIETNIDIELTFDRLINELSTESDTTSSLESLVIKEILESSNKKINMTSLNAKFSRKCTIAVLNAVVKLLSEKKFGKSCTQKNANGPSTKVFIRCYIPDISIINTSFMQEYGVDLEKFKASNESFENVTEDSAGNEIIYSILIDCIFINYL